MSTAIEHLRKRRSGMVRAAEILWLIAMVAELITGQLFPYHALKHDFLGDRVDVPPKLAGWLLDQGLPVMQGFAAAPSPTYLYGMGYAVLAQSVFFTGVVAALLGRKFLFFACLALTLFQPEWIGGASHVPLCTVMFLISCVFVGRCLIKRAWRAAGACVATAVLILAIHDANLIWTEAHPSLQMASREDAAQAQFLSRLEPVLTAAPAERHEDVRYVRAQIAAVRHNWSGLSAVGSLDSRRIQYTPYKRARLVILADDLRAVADPVKAAEPRFEWQVSRSIMVALDAVCLILTGLNLWTGRRLKRIGKVSDELDRLPRPHRAAA